MIGFKSLILLAVASVLGTAAGLDRLEVSVVVAGSPGKSNASFG